MKIYTLYFYQIRNFKQNIIPISICLSDLEAIYYHITIAGLPIKII